MRKIPMNSFAFTDYQHPEKGFTFVTVLLMITILSISLPLLGYMIQSVNSKSNYSEISVQQFFQFVRDDIIDATNIQVTTGKLYLIKPHEQITASLELYGSLIRRQVNGKGHEIYLRDVEGITFTPLPYGVQVTVITTSGEKYEKKFAKY
ncbi:competence type IV pilus minor pilin ComGF [Oceanobacillus polygoni]|uniref:Competence protein ComGF n=1 Tax=Oceanobacillus polygoni TaxID=1235259 RepID=A0A9X0YUA3_9BACI|nr:competence type IV pilus minor pilin ComGF [Oceanobacillus polygoni]MBP2078201.1 competence protein ComGF [Oceanobacillus polygoni]